MFSRSQEDYGSAYLPSAFSMTLGLPDSMRATHELVVPRSIPTTLSTTNKIRHFVRTDCDCVMRRRLALSVALERPHGQLSMIKEYLRGKGAVVLLDEAALKRASLALLEKVGQHLLCQR